jgi:hypothetical protein
MKKMFNDRLPSRDPPGQLDTGLYQEIITAIKLIEEYKITHGNQISRSLTADEIKQGLNGTSQSIMVPTALGRERELDMVYKDHVDGSPVIVEAKSTQRVDTHQLEVNVKLAQHHRGKLVYSLDGDKPGQERALKDQYAKLIDEGGKPYPPGLFDVIHTRNDSYASLYFQGRSTIPSGRGIAEMGRVGGLAPMVTEDAIMDSDFNPDNGEEWEPRFA